MIDAGADLVIGGHPHVTQGVEYQQGKLIVYSLGNLVFDGFDYAVARSRWLLRLTLDKHGLLAWDTLAVKIDEDGAPHPDTGIATPGGRRPAGGPRHPGMPEPLKSWVKASAPAGTGSL